MEQQQEVGTLSLNEIIHREAEPLVSNVRHGACNPEDRAIRVTYFLPC